MYYNYIDWDVFFNPANLCNTQIVNFKIILAYGDCV